MYEPAIHAGPLLVWLWSRVQLCVHEECVALAERGRSESSPRWLSQLQHSVARIGFSGYLAWNASNSAVVWCE